jgi:hypothetical protein
MSKNTSRNAYLLLHGFSRRMVMWPEMELATSVLCLLATYRRQLALEFVETCRPLFKQPISFSLPYAKKLSLQ